MKYLEHLYSSKNKIVLYFNSSVYFCNNLKISNLNCHELQVVDSINIYKFRALALLKKRLMKKYTELLYLTITFLFILSSCDVIEEPYMNKQTIVNDTNQTVYTKKVLVEDYTGQKCGNCPRAHEKMTELIGIYQNKIIPLAVHVGFFAIPSSSPYTTDYRSAVGNDLNNYFKNSNAGMPNGMVNRTELSGDVILQFANWEQVVQSQLALEPEINIGIENTYNSTSKSLQSIITLTSLKDFNQTLKLCVYLKEDSLVSAQMDYEKTPSDILNYTHRNVLRDAINSTWGEIVSDQNIINKQVITKTFNYTLNSQYKPENCYVLAYVYYDDTKQIIQADERKIIY